MIPMMSKSIVVSTTLDEETKRQAETVLESKELPFTPLTPNSETLAAMQELENDELRSYETVAELFEDLNAQDQASWKA